jgi:hypothetical protein
LSLNAIVERRIEGLKAPQSANVLGQAVVDFDAPTRRPVRVSFEATERALALRRTGGPPIIRSEMARALGRVLAHEIGHVLLGPPYHDQAGLMRTEFRTDELAAQDRAPFRLMCSRIARLRNRLRVLTGAPRLEQPDPWMELEHLETCLPGQAVQ